MPIPMTSQFTLVNCNAPVQTLTNINYEMTAKPQSLGSVWPLHACLGHTNLNICFSDPAGSHFAEFQKKKKKGVWSSVGNNKCRILTRCMHISAVLRNRRCTCGLSCCQLISRSTSS